MLYYGSMRGLHDRMIQRASERYHIQVIVAWSGSSVQPSTVKACMQEIEEKALSAIKASMPPVVQSKKSLQKKK